MSALFWGPFFGILDFEPHSTRGQTPKSRVDYADMYLKSGPA